MAGNECYSKDAYIMAGGSKRERGRKQSPHIPFKVMPLMTHFLQSFHNFPMAPSVEDQAFNTGTFGDSQDSNHNNLVTVSSKV
jgi:hypothetical protein